MLGTLEPLLRPGGEVFGACEGGVRPGGAAGRAKSVVMPSAKPVRRRRTRGRRGLAGCGAPLLASPRLQPTPPRGEEPYAGRVL
jgi:hypothetical protein